MTNEGTEVEKTRKNDEPWTDQERAAFVQHVLAQADISSILNDLPEALGKEGFPTRARAAVSRLL